MRHEQHASMLAALVGLRRLPGPAARLGSEVGCRGSVPKWRTKAGDLVPIDRMTDDHLRNALNHMRRRAAVLAEEYDEEASSAASFDGESMASYYASGSADDAHARWARCLRWVGLLAAEKERRGL